MHLTISTLLVLLFYHLAGPSCVDGFGFGLAGRRFTITTASEDEVNPSSTTTTEDTRESEAIADEVLDKLKEQEDQEEAAKSRGGGQALAKSASKYGVVIVGGGDEHKHSPPPPPHHHGHEGGGAKVYSWGKGYKGGWGSWGEGGWFGKPPKKLLIIHNDKGKGEHKHEHSHSHTHHHHHHKHDKKHAAAASGAAGAAAAASEQDEYIPPHERDYTIKSSSGLGGRTIMGGRQQAMETSGTGKKTSSSAFSAIPNKWSLLKRLSSSRDSDEVEDESRSRAPPPAIEGERSVAEEEDLPQDYVVSIEKHAEWDAENPNRKIIHPVKKTVKRLGGGAAAAGSDEMESSVGSSSSPRSRRNKSSPKRSPPARLRPAADDAVADPADDIDDDEPDSEKLLPHHYGVFRR